MSSFGVEDITEDSFVYDMKLLLGSMILGVKHVLLLIPAQGSGCVINNASIVGFASGYGPRVYSCATGHRSGIDPTRIHTFPRCVMTTLPRVDLPHDSRILRTAAQGELEQIQFLLGHVSVQTTERYLGCKQRIRSAVNDRIGIEPNP